MRFGEKIAFLYIFIFLINDGFYVFDANLWREYKQQFYIFSWSLSYFMWEIYIVFSLFFHSLFGCRSGVGFKIHKTLKHVAFYCPQ